jgi:hypothetical protein
MEKNKDRKYLLLAWLICLFIWMAIQAIMNPSLNTIVWAVSTFIVIITESRQ